MRKEIQAFDYADTILKAVGKGVLITTQVGEKINPMTIGWGMLGIEWGKPIFIAFVRESRYTHQMLNESGCFTVNVPLGEYDKKIAGYCGTMSGRDVDKVKELGLTPVAGECVNAPGLKEYPLTLECKVLYQQLQDRDALPESVMKYYPEEVPSEFSGSNRDIHVAYYGEILKAYILE